MARALLLVFLLILPVSARDYYREAERLFEVGKFASAASAYELYVAKRPEGPLVPAALMGAAWAHLQAGAPESALTNLAILESGGGEKRMKDLFLYTRGLALTRTRDFAAAAESLRSLTIEHPKSPLLRDAQLQLASCLLETKGYDEAASILDALESDARGLLRIEVLTLRLETFMKKRDYERGLEAIDGLLAVPPYATAKRSSMTREDLLYRKAALLERLERSPRPVLEIYLREFPEGAHAARVQRMLAESAATREEKIRRLLNAVVLGDEEPYASENRFILAELSWEAGNARVAVREWKMLVIKHGASGEAIQAIARLRQNAAVEDLRDPRFMRSLQGMVDEREEDLESAGALEDAREILSLGKSRTPREIPGPEKTAPPALEIPVTKPADPAPRDVAAPEKIDARILLWLAKCPRPVRVLILPLSADKAREGDYLKSLIHSIRQKLLRTPGYRVLGNDAWYRFLRGEKAAADVYISFDARIVGDGAAGVEFEAHWDFPSISSKATESYVMNPLADEVEILSLAEKITARLR